jgi:hypothetical protein
MFLRSKTRKKDGNEHRYWSVVENRRVADGRVVQRHVLSLGEINDSQRAAWCRSIAAFDEDRAEAAQIAVFPEERPAPELSCMIVHVMVGGLVVCACLAPARGLANVHRRLAVHAQTDDPWVFSAPILGPNVGEDGVGFRDFFWGLALSTARKR